MNAQKASYYGIWHSLGERWLEEDWLQSLKKPLHPRQSLTNSIPDAKEGPGPSAHLHHQVKVQEEADQREDRQSRDLWAESVHPWTQPRRLKGRPYPSWAGQVQSNSGCVVSAY